MVFPVLGTLRKYKTRNPFETHVPAKAGLVFPVFTKHVRRQSAEAGRWLAYLEAVP